MKSLPPALLSLAFALSAATCSGSTGDPPARAEGGAVRYTIEDLGKGVPFAINASGQIVGSEQPQWDWKAFLLDGKETRWLGTLGGKESHGYGLNDRGEAVGYSTDAAGERYAFVWRGGRMEKIERLPGASSGWANSLNERGEVVGGGVLGGTERAWRWRSGVVRPLEGLVPGGETRAHAVNDAGWIVGSAKAADGNSHAVLWKEDLNPVDLGTLGGRESYATGIDAAGRVVGVARTGAGVQHAFLWENGKMRDLMPPGVNGGAEDVNDCGQVVGWAATAGEGARAVLWDGGRMLYLDELVPKRSGWRRLTEAAAINDRGEIVGKGYRGSEPRAFVMRPAR